MKETLKSVESSQSNKNVYIPPRFRVKDPISSDQVKEHPMYTPTSRDYGLNPVTDQTKAKRFPKSNTFSSGLVGKNYTNNSLNTSADKGTPIYSTSLSF